MNTEILRVEPESPDPAIIAHAANLLRAGRLVAFPTETVYGLGADALNATAVRGIFTAKGRPPSNPLIVHVATPEQVVNVAAEWPATAQMLATRFWPGPLTIVVPKTPIVPDEVTAGGPTVAVRCPIHPIARALLAAVGVPVAAPSANRSMELSPTRADHVFRSLNGRIDLVLDGGACPGGLESTVVDVTGPVVRLLRPGLITIPMLQSVVGGVVTANREPPPSDTVARSPGQMAKHYSPRTPLVIAERVEFEGVQAELRRGGKRLICWELPSDPTEAAARLYDTLHDFDRQEADVIAIALPPDTPEWAAVRDRLLRAAATE